MTSGPEPRAIACFAAYQDLPPAAQALFGDGLFGSGAWFETVTAAALPPGASPVFVVITRQGRPEAVFPMLRQPGALSALTTPYTCLWQPALAPHVDGAALRGIGAAFGAWCRAFPVVRLDALDLTAPAWPALLAGLRAARLVPLPFDHFGNWSARVPDSGWSAYLAARPGQLRETLRRRGKQLASAGATLRLVTSQADLAAGVAAYESVYAASWKQAEPYPAFNAALMQCCARQGSLRLGLLEQAGQVLAAQFWVVQGRWAGVQKLAHAEAHKAASPGTVLTGMMIRHLIEQDGVTELDFGRGDDAYKRDWTDTRRQRHGLLLANPWRPAGLAAILRRRLRDIVKKGVLF